MSVADRILEIRHKFGLTQEKFAKKIGVTTDEVDRWEAGKTRLDDGKLYAIGYHFNVDVKWLRTGKGNFYKKQEIDPAIRKQVKDDLVNSIFRMLPEPVQSLILLTIADNLAEINFFNSDIPANDDEMAEETQEESETEEEASDDATAPETTTKDSDKANVAPPNAPTPPASLLPE